MKSWVIFIKNMSCYTYMLRNQNTSNTIFDIKKQTRPWTIIFLIKYTAENDEERVITDFFFFREWWDIGNFLFFKEVIRELRGWSSICYYRHYFKLRFFIFSRCKLGRCNRLCFLKKWFANWEDDQVYIITDTILN